MFTAMHTRRIATLNSWKNDGCYRQRLAAMANQLTQVKPDAIALQESFAGGGDDTARALSQGLGLQSLVAPGRRKMRHHQGEQVNSTSSLCWLASPQASRAATSIHLEEHPLDSDRQLQRLRWQPDKDRTPICIGHVHVTHCDDVALGFGRLSRRG